MRSNMRYRFNLAGFYGALLVSLTIPVYWTFVASDLRWPVTALVFFVMMWRIEMVLALKRLKMEKGLVDDQLRAIRKHLDIQTNADKSHEFQNGE